MAEPSRLKLTRGQHEVLSHLVRSQSGLSVPEISRDLRKSYRGWSRGKLVSLRRRGFVAQVGELSSGGRRWAVTDSGRRFIVDKLDSGRSAPPPAASSRQSEDRRFTSVDSAAAFASSAFIGDVCVMASATKAPTGVDRLIGEKIKARRRARSFSQSKLADAIGVTFQQIQKYENGRNRVTMSRLQKIAEVLGVSMSVFVDEGQEHTAAAAHSPRALQLAADFDSLDEQSRDAVEIIVRLLVTRRVGADDNGASALAATNGTPDRGVAVIGASQVAKRTRRKAFPARLTMAEKARRKEG